jgi:hypothetical protein
LPIFAFNLRVRLTNLPANWFTNLLIGIAGFAADNPQMILSIADKMMMQDQCDCGATNPMCPPLRSADVAQKCLPPPPSVTRFRGGGVHDVLDSENLFHDEECLEFWGE